jgi:hypothetical protein
MGPHLAQVPFEIMVASRLLSQGQIGQGVECDVGGLDFLANSAQLFRQGKYNPILFQMTIGFGNAVGEHKIA